MERFLRKRNPEEASASSSAGASAPARASAVPSKGSVALEHAVASGASASSARAASAEAHASAEAEPDECELSDLEVSSCSSNGVEREQDLTLCDQETAAWLSSRRETQTGHHLKHRARCVLRLMAGVVGQTNKLIRSAPAVRKMHMSNKRGNGKSARTYKSTQVLEASVKAKGAAALDALRMSPEADVNEVEAALTALTTISHARAAMLHQSGLRLHVPTLSSKSLARIVVELGATQRGKRGAQKGVTLAQAKAIWRQQSAVIVALHTGAPEVVQESSGDGVGGDNMNPSALEPREGDGAEALPTEAMLDEAQLEYATGAWAQWRGRQGYRELMNVVAEWEEIKLPQFRVANAAELTEKMVAARRRQQNRKSARAQRGAPQAFREEALGRLVNDLSARPETIITLAGF